MSLGVISIFIAGQPIGGQPLAMHGTFGLKETSTPIKLDLENDDDQDPEWEEQEAEQVSLSCRNCFDRVEYRIFEASGMPHLPLQSHQGRW